MTFKGLLAYDGTRYFGWQKTAAGPSIQEELEKALAQVTGETTSIEAASRTDRGVHAEGQVIQFALRKETDPRRLLRSLNAVLPSDIRIREIAISDFHPTLDASGKEYRYQICFDPVQEPTDHLYSWHFRYPLDFTKVETAAASLIGTHDFSAFANEEETNPICTIESILFQNGSFWVKGDRFLYKMVRNIVGTLVYIGCGKLAPDSVPLILESRDRKTGGLTAPAHGLHLHQVFYPVK